MKCEGYTVIEIAEQTLKDFSEEFEGCTQKDTEKIIRQLFAGGKKRGILKSLVMEILEQYQ